MKMNMDAKTRDELLFGEFDLGKYGGGIRRFDDLNYETLKYLMEQRFISYDDCQNCSPCAGDIMHFMANHPQFTAHGYAVSPTRGDYRMTIEGVDLQGDYDHETLLDFVGMFRFADEFDIEHNELYCWYD